MPVTASPITFSVPEFRTGKKASYVTATTGFLGVYEPSRMPLQIVAPRPGTEQGAGSRYLWAHSGFAYNVVVAPQGGSPPYRFFLSAGASGATITAEAPSWNPYCYLWGRINWAAPSGTQVMTVRVIDQEGAQATASWLVTTQNNKFIFFDASAGNDATGDGTITLPWQTMAKWTGTLNSDTTHQYKICVYKNGTYNAAAYDVNSNMTLHDNKPTGHIRYPGHDPVWDLSAATITTNVGGVGATNDIYLAIRTVSGVAGRDNLKLMAFNGSQNRVVTDRISFEDPPASNLGNDNPACVYCSDGDTHDYFAMVDTTWNNLLPDVPGGACTDFYQTTNLTILGGQGTAINSRFGVYAKGDNDIVSIFGVDLWDESGNTSTTCKFFFQQSQAGAGAEIEVAYCRAFQGDGSGNQVSTLLAGSSGSIWGTGHYYRMTYAGRLKFDGFAAANGTCNFSNSIYYCDAVPAVAAEVVQSGNIARARSDMATDLLNGSLTGSFAATYYGIKGAEVAPA